MVSQNPSATESVAEAILKYSIHAAGNFASHGLARSVEMVQRLRIRSWSTATEPSHGKLFKRHLAGGAIAGITVGVVVAAVLLAICIYPFCVYRIKHRRHADHPSFDAEAAMATALGGPPGDATVPHHRASSSDSLKQNGEVARGETGGRGDRELEWATSQDGHDLAYPNGAYGQYGDPRFPDQHVNGEYRVQAEPFPLLGCYDGEFAPRISEDHQPGVLKGTSADYYSPDIPSEAFGMVTEPEPTFSSPIRTSSYGSSLRYNMMHMFRRKSGKDGTLSSTTSRAPGEDSLPAAIVPHLNGATPLQPIITTGDRVESPTDMSPTSPSDPVQSVPETENTPITHHATHEPENAVKTPPESPYPPYQQFAKSASPPAHAAPGTVNPMDIMPASTESEVWHRTEHQLFVSSTDGSPDHYEKTPQQELGSGASIPSPSPTPPESHAQPVFTVQSPDAAPDSAPGNIEIPVESEPVHFEESHPAVLSSPANHDNLAPPDGRHPSYPSDQSTPFPGSTFTDISSQNTPSTQLDSPSPQSVGSSDFRHSASPQSGVGAHSPRTGIYRCDEPGCSQTFDQPHKLKHHQRYHSKDHKCLYPGCGKGFGTKTHLQRHINDRHEKKKKFHCSVPGCDYSRTGGKAFPRKDNWKRHMTKIHNIDQKQLPEPIEVDVEMGGT